MPSQARVEEVLRWLKKSGSPEGVAALARYAIPSERAFGVSVSNLKAHARTLGQGHKLALELWSSGYYEARMLAAYVDRAEEVTSKQMDQWSADFDNWAICDTICFHLFDRTPLAWQKIPEYGRARAEYKKRAAFALLWGLSVHDKNTSTAVFLSQLPLIERASTDPRYYVKKGIDMALRAMGKKRDPATKAAVLEFALKLAASADENQAWIGRNTLRELKKKA
jgi:3-methyladenine DNA glycosylase AlkD